MKPQKKTLAQIVSKFVGKPFEHGSFGPDSYDCIGLVYAFLLEAGKAENLVVNVGMWNLNNYSELDKRTNHKEAHEKLFEVFKANGKEVALTEKLAGDPVIIKDITGDFYPAIYVGNGNFISAFRDIGVTVKKLDKTIYEIVMVRRL